MTLDIERTDTKFSQRKCPDCGSGNPRYRVIMASHPVKDDEGEYLYVCGKCAKKMKRLWNSLLGEV